MQPGPSISALGPASACDAFQVGRRERALLLAAFQLGDLGVSQLSPNYGSAHLDHLGVPIALRRALPLVKTAAVLALVVASNRRPALRVVAGALVAYYSAAVTFHVLADDKPSDVAPAAACGLVAATLV